MSPALFLVPVLGAFCCCVVSGPLSLHFRGNTRVEEACEMYTRAANMFKIAKNWSGESSPRFSGGLLSPQHPPVEFYIPVEPRFFFPSPI